MLRKIYSLMSSGSILGLFLQVLPITFVIGIAYAVCRFIRIKRHGNTFCFGKEIMRLLFVCYLTGLVNLTLVPANMWINIWARLIVGYSDNSIVLFSGEFNLVPTVVRVLSGELTLGKWTVEMLVGNCLMLIPLGFFLPFVLDGISGKFALIIAAATPIVIEVMQPIVGRSFDTDDLITNFLGIIVGYGIAVVIKTLYGKNSALLKKNEKAD